MHSSTRPSPRVTWPQKLVTSAVHALSIASTAPATRSLSCDCADVVESGHANARQAAEVITILGLILITNLLTRYPRHPYSARRRSRDREIALGGGGIVRMVAQEPRPPGAEEKAEPAMAAQARVAQLRLQKPQNGQHRRPGSDHAGQAQRLLVKRGEVITKSPHWRTLRRLSCTGQLFDSGRV